MNGGDEDDGKNEMTAVSTGDGKMTEEVSPSITSNDNDSVDTETTG
jgi:hypothetical protein